MKITYRRAALGVAVWAMVSLPTLAQHDGHQMPSSASSASPATCAQSSQGVTRGIDTLVGRIDELRQTNDAAKMRATVGDLQVALAQMKTQLADCTALTQASNAMGNMGAMDQSKMPMTPATPVMQPGSPTTAADAKTAAPMAGMDHSKMQMAPKSPAASGGTKPAAPMAGMDHSKMAGSPSAKSPAKKPGAEPSKMPAMDHSKMTGGTKTAAPMAGMDHSKMTDEKPAPVAGAAPPKAAPAPTVLFALRTQPAPPRSGKNDFEVTVKDADGKPIADAQVSLEFSMPAMPTMKVPEVRLTSTGNGSYKGSATMGMAGDWDVTVKAARNGQQLDTKKMRLTTK